jgi:tetratricopeptide (TPR) repeat protein
MRFLRLITFAVLVLAVPPVCLYASRFLGLIHVQTLFDWIKLGLAFYVTWLTLLFAFFQAKPHIRQTFGFKSSPNDAQPARADFQFKVVRPGDLYNTITTLPHAEIPYTTRLPDAEYESLVAAMRGAAHLIITGRAGLGKTREAIEYIARIEAETGEKVSVLVPTGTLEVPLDVDIHKLHRNVVLFIDDLPAYAAVPYKSFETTDPKLQDNFRQRLEQTIRVFSKLYGNRFHVVATAKVEPESEAQIDWSDSFWKKFTVLPLPDLSRDRRYSFLQSAEAFFGLKLSLSAKLLLSERSDGTFGGLIFPLIQETRTEHAGLITSAEVERYRCTYPNDWEEQIYLRHFANNKYRRNLLSASSLLRQAGITLYSFLVVDLAARLCSPHFPFLFRWRVRKELEPISDWIRPKGLLLECEDAYLKGKGDLQDPKQRDLLLASVYRSIRNPTLLGLLLWSVHQLIDILVYQNDEPLLALDVSKRLLKVDPRNARAWTRIAGIYQQLHQYREAERAAQESIRLYGHPDALARLASIQASLNRPSSSINSYREAIKKRPTSDFLLAQLGVMLSKTGNDQEAIAVGRKAVELNPTLPINHILLGISLDKAKNYQQAIDSFQRAITLDEHDAMAWWSLGITYSKAGQVDKAIEAGQKGIEFAPLTSTAWANQAQTYDRCGQAEASIPLFTRALELEPENVDTLIAFGVALDHAGQYEKALQTLRQAVKIAPKNVGALITLAYALESASPSGSAEAVEILKRAADLQPTNVQVLTTLAYVLNAKTLRRHEEAVDVLNRAKAIEPQNVTVLVTLGYSLSKSRRNEEAREVLNQALQIEPENVEALLTLGHVLGLTGEQQESVALLQKAASINPRRIRTWLTLASIAHKQGDAKAEEQALLKAVENDPNECEAWHGLGVLYTDLQQFDKAVKVLGTVFKIDADYSHAFITARILLLRMGVAKAKLTDEAIALLPLLSEAAAKLKQRVKQGQETLPSTGGEKADELWVLGESYLESNQIEQAIQAFSEAIESNPNYFSALEQLGIELNYSDRFSESLRVAQKLTEIRPNNAKYVYALATTYRKVGDNSKAKEYYERAIELRPRSKYADRARLKLQELEGLQGIGPESKD